MLKSFFKSLLKTPKKKDLIQEGSILKKFNENMDYILNRKPKMTDGDIMDLYMSHRDDHAGATDYIKKFRESKKKEPKSAHDQLDDIINKIVPEFKNRTGKAAESKYEYSKGIIGRKNTH